MIRPATPDDAYVLGRLRLLMWNEMHREPAHDKTFLERSFVFWYEHLTAGTARSWLAEDGGTAVGMASLLLNDHPPLPEIERRRGYITGVYVAPTHRRQGYARRLMAAAIEWSRTTGLQRLELRTSEAGRPLYTMLGFEPRETLMLDLKGQ